MRIGRQWPSFGEDDMNAWEEGQQPSGPVTNEEALELHRAAARARSRSRDQAAEHGAT